MVPLRLRLRNFMSYREEAPVLDLENIHVACLSGANGHGKTALLEAMTWALWGGARGREDLTDELIAHGADEMEVELEFAAAGRRYRVVRKRSRSSPRQPGRTVLDLQVAGEGGFRSIAGNSVRETERLIREIVRLDYRTFVASAFLLQGRADIFTAEKTPAQRKELLAEVLGLTLYDRLEERAREQARERRTAKERLQFTIGENEAEVQQKPTYEAERDQLVTALDGTRAALQEQGTRIAQLQGELHRLEYQRSQRDDLQAQLQQAQSDLLRTTQEVEQRQGRLRAYEEVRARREAIEAGHRRLQEARAALTAVVQAQQRYIALQEQVRAAEQVVQEARNKLLMEQERYAAQLSELRKRVDALPALEQERLLVEDRVQELARWEQGLEELRERERALLEEVQELTAANRQRRKEMEELRERLDLLAQPGEACCPVCQQPLTEEHRQELLAQYQRDGEALRDAYRATQETIQAREKQRAGIAERLKELEAQLQRELSEALRSRGQVEEALKAAQQASEQAKWVQAELEAVRARLEAGDFALAEQQALAACRAELAQLAYDPAAYEALRREVTELEPVEGEVRLLEEADARWEEETRALAQAQEAVERLRQRVAELEARRAELETALAAEASLREELSAAQRREQELRLEEARLERLLGAALQKLDAVAFLERRLEQDREELRRLEREQGIYEELARAFGKGGVQALLIERAVPEIEAEANRLLARMSDGRLAVKLETQRQTQQGQVRETLEIRVADELGTRSYETYSGGEAFRVNLALRIALSRLLARRAGAPLPTLIIDEGFGTQDASGREKLVEVLRLIQEDFERILVITHLDDLREAFPVRIEVTKTARGSTFQMVL